MTLSLFILMIIIYSHDHYLFSWSLFILMIIVYSHFTLISEYNKVFIYIACNKGLSWSWVYGSWIYNYLCNQCLSPLKLWVRTPFVARCTNVLYTTLCDKVCQWLATGRWFSPGTPVASTNKTDFHNITKIMLKVALNTINQTKLKCLNWYLILNKVQI